MSGMSNNRARHAEEGVPRGDDQGTCLACRAEAEEAGLSVEEWQPPSLLLPPRGAPSEQPASIPQPRGGPLACRAEAEEAGLSVEECHWSPLGAGIPSRCSNSRWLPPPHGMALEAALEAAAAVVTAAAALLASSAWQPPYLLPPPRGAPSEQPAPNRGSSRGRASATAPAVRPSVWDHANEPLAADRSRFCFPPKLQPKRSDPRLT